jgi:hypothetical protein
MHQARHRFDVAWNERLARNKVLQRADWYGNALNGCLWAVNSRACTDWCVPIGGSRNPYRARILRRNSCIDTDNRAALLSARNAPRLRKWSAPSPLLYSFASAARKPGPSQEQTAERATPSLTLHSGVAMPSKKEGSSINNSTTKLSKFARACRALYSHPSSRTEDRVQSVPVRRHLFESHVCCMSSLCLNN